MVCIPLLNRFLCSECVDEMHNLGFLVRAGAHDIRVMKNIISGYRMASGYRRTLYQFCISMTQVHDTNFLTKCLPIQHRVHQDYLAANYCPTVEEGQQDFCVEKLARYYIGMLVREHS